MGYSPLERLIATLTPLECLICRREGNMLCTSCAETKLPEQISRCYLCNKLTLQRRICTSCSSRSRLRRVWWLGSYNTELKELIFAMKYERCRAAARECGALLAKIIGYLPPGTLITHLPTASQRVRQRGFDQAALIAESVASSLGCTYTPLLSRTTQVDQIGKNRIERQKQMRESFACYETDKVTGKTILLIDDVITTGASIEAAASVLRKAGAVHVDAAVIARHYLK